VPIDDRQNFILGDLREALAECGNELTKLASVVGGKDRHLSMSPSPDHPSIPPASTGVFELLIFRGRLSTAAKAKLTVNYLVMDKKPRRVQTTAHGDIPGPGLEFHIQRV
jgi:hypothetical protein